MTPITEQDLDPLVPGVWRRWLREISPRVRWLGGDYMVSLGDNTGANKQSIRNARDVEVAAIDSLGNMALAGALTWAGALTAWTPGTTGVSVGNGSITGKYVLMGKLCYVNINLTFGTTTTVGAVNTFTGLPVTPNNGMLLTGWAVRQGVGFIPIYTVIASGQVNTQPVIQSTGAVVSATSPYTWGNADVWAVSGVYQVA